MSHDEISPYEMLLTRVCRQLVLQCRRAAGTLNLRKFNTKVEYEVLRWYFSEKRLKYAYH